MIAIAQYLQLLLAIPCAANGTTTSAATTLNMSSVRRTSSRWVASSGLRGARFTLPLLPESIGAVVYAAVVFGESDARRESGNHSVGGSKMSSRMRPASTALAVPSMPAASGTPNAILALTCR
jgi:hypothetical protein